MPSAASTKNQSGQWPARPHALYGSTCGYERPACQRWYALAQLLRGDHGLNEVKTQRALGAFRFAQDAEIRAALGGPPGYLGPVGVRVQVIADRTVAAMSDFVCGANEENFHLAGVNWVRDLPEPTAVADIRNVMEGDPSPDGKGSLRIQRGIEVGHIFQLRTKYSEALKATVLDATGTARPLEMGCYGIGVTRVVAAAIEQHHDERGIALPPALAPFEVCLVPIAYRKNEAVRAAADALYAELQQAGVQVLLEDRDERPGVLFADMDLIGIPCRIVLSERSLGAQQVEFKRRLDAQPSAVPLAGLVPFVREQLASA